MTEPIVASMSPSFKRQQIARTRLAKEFGDQPHTILYSMRVTGKGKRKWYAYCQTCDRLLIDNLFNKAQTEKWVTENHGI